jgi:ribonuclease P protein component
LTLAGFQTIGARNNGRPLAALFSYIRGMSDEAHFPAEQPGPQAAARLSPSQRDGGRAQDPERSSRPRPQEAQRLVNLRKRADFLAANRGKRFPMPGFVLLVRQRDDGDETIRVGFTVTKKIGNAVVRNRMKRRFRELARELLTAGGVPGADHVMIGREGGIERDFNLLRQDLAKALEKARR